MAFRVFIANFDPSEKLNFRMDNYFLIPVSLKHVELVCENKDTDNYLSCHWHEHVAES